MYFKTTKIRSSKGDELDRIIALSPAFVNAYLSKCLKTAYRAMCRHAWEYFVKSI